MRIEFLDDWEESRHLDSVRLNGRRLSRAVVVAVNPALDRDATKAYLDRRKDGLDSIGVEVDGRHLVIVGKGLPAVGQRDALEISGRAARFLYRENEPNEFVEGFSETARGKSGAAYLLGGMAIGGIGAYLATLAGFTAFPIGLSMIFCGVAAGLLAQAGRGAVGGFLASNRPADFKVTNRLADPSTRQISELEKRAIVGEGVLRLASGFEEANA